MSSSKINRIEARQILDSRGNPTIEVGVETQAGVFYATVPSGASTGKYEAVELRDEGHEYMGRGVSGAVKNINEIIAPKLVGQDVTLQQELDEKMIEMDGTGNKSQLGGNALCAVSLGLCRAGAGTKGLELFQYVKRIAQKEHWISVDEYRIPSPSFNIINGGAHAGNDLDFQEFMIAPQAESFSEKLRIGVEIYHRLKARLAKRYGELATSLGDEGGFAPPLNLPVQAIDLILFSAKELGYEEEIGLILDVAASQFLSNDHYEMGGQEFSSEELISYYQELSSRYPILGLEDPLAEDDWEGFQEITKRMGDEIMIIGDDLLVTNPKRIKECQQKKAANSMILKINQIGTVSEALSAAKLAQESNWKIIVSHRSGETTDDFIADFAVGIGADFIKTGAPARGERVVKYNRLLKIAEELNL